MSNPFNHQQDDAFEKQVEFLEGMYKDWLGNLQKDAYARGVIIPAEVIAMAFSNLRDHYDILWQEYDIDEQYKRLLEEEE